MNKKGVGMGYFYLFLFTGIFYFFGDIFLSNWDKIPGSIIDGNLINYILEHINLYVTGANPLHSTLWNMPIFYPAQNVLAFSDSMLSIAPLYVLLRFVFDPYISFSMTVILICVLNYTLFYFILRRLGFSKLLSSFGSFLYAFSYVNKITIMHVQLIIHFFYLGAALSLLYVSKHNTKRKNYILFLLASSLYALGFYSSFYTGFWVTFVLLMAGIVCVINNKYRRSLKIFVLRYDREILISVILAFLILMPLAKMYISTGISRPYEMVLFNLPVISTYFTGHSYFIRNFLPFMLEDFNIEYSLMFTYALFIFGLAGLLRVKKYGTLLFVTFLISILVTPKFIYLNEFSFWKLFYNVLPGAIGIRETIRIILILNPLLVFGFVNFIATSKWNKTILILISVIVLFEQYVYDSYNRRSFIEEKNLQAEIEETYLPKNCKYLDVDFDVENETPFTGIEEDIARIRLMWFASEHGFYFVSGYSGISESEDYQNPERENLKKLPEYCVITKKIR